MATKRKNDRDRIVKVARDRLLLRLGYDPSTMSEVSIVLVTDAVEPVRIEVRAGTDDVGRFPIWDLTEEQRAAFESLQKEVRAPAEEQP